MMLARRLAILLGIMSVISSNIANATVDEVLQKERTDIIKRYVKLLGHGDYQAIPKLFTEHAVAVSPTGEAENINRFYETVFRSTFSSPESRLINIFDGRLKDNMMTAYYNMTWVNADGELESARFVDLFIFQVNSVKIKTIYVFSNSFREDVANHKTDIKPV